MKNKFPVLNTLLTIANVIAVIIGAIGILSVIIGLGSSIDDGALLRIYIGVPLVVCGLLIRLSVEMCWVFLEIEKNTRKEQPDVETPEIPK